MDAINIMKSNLKIEFKIELTNNNASFIIIFHHLIFVRHSRVEHRGQEKRFHQKSRHQIGPYEEREFFCLFFDFLNYEN